MKKKELIFYMMHEMRSLLFAALNMFFFSPILKKKKKILKCLVADMFTLPFSCVCVCITDNAGAACCVTVCLILEPHFHRIS